MENLDIKLPIFLDLSAGTDALNDLEKIETACIRSGVLLTFKCKGDKEIEYIKSRYYDTKTDGDIISVRTLFYKIPSPVYIETERLTVSDIAEKDKDDYFRLYTDIDLNKWWGYDYNDDLNGDKPTPDWFYNFQKSLKDKKEEYSLAVRVDGKMVGELVLHNFDFYGGIEMGFRFFRECHGKGYATESALALKEFVRKVVCAKRIKSRCFKENIPSKNLITRLGLKPCREDKTHYYFGQDLK